MTYRVSLPEKTLEHWASIYISNRFPGANVWWPTQGDDIALDLFTAAASAIRPSQLLVLEIKTSTWLGPRRGHQVNIDTAQLSDYLRRIGPRGLTLPAYYVFPAPHWDGPIVPPAPTYGAPGSRPLPLRVSTVANGDVTDPTTWWRRRSGDQWFGHWTYVMPATQVAASLDASWQSTLLAKKAASPPASRAKVTTSEPLSETLAVPPAPLYEVSPSLRPKWSTIIPLLKGPRPTIWPDFWNDLLLPYALTPGMRVGSSPGSIKVVTNDQLVASGGRVDWDTVDEVAASDWFREQDVFDFLADQRSDDAADQSNDRDVRRAIVALPVS
jgi:hypothetical protein